MNFSCIEEVSEWSFSQRVLRSALPVLVVVWADGRGAEQGFLKLVEEWAPQARGRLRIFRLRRRALVGAGGAFRYSAGSRLGVIQPGCDVLPVYWRGVAARAG